MINPLHPSPTSLSDRNRTILVASDRHKRHRPQAAPRTRPPSDNLSICKLSATFCKDRNPHRCWLKRRSSNLSRWIPHREGTFWPFRTDMVGRENGFRSRLTAEVEGQPRILTLSDVLVAHGLPSCVAIRSSAEDAKCCPRARGCFPPAMWKRSAAAHDTSSSKNAGRQLRKT